MASCLVFAGHDPSGGAGIQADIQTLTAMDCHPNTIVTCLTVQNTQHVHQVKPVSAELIWEQAHCLLSDIPVQAIKIGLLPSVEVVEVIANLLSQYPDIPVVLDPVLRASSGAILQDQATCDMIKSTLFPLTTVLTPNGPEAGFYTLADTVNDCGLLLLDAGCDFVLISGGHEQGEVLINRFYGQQCCLESFSWPRLVGDYHGSGCTLATAIAGLLAQGKELRSAIYLAQEFTWQSLALAYRVGQGRDIPRRAYWS